MFIKEHPRFFVFLNAYFSGKKCYNGRQDYMDDITVIIKKAKANLIEENRGTLYVKVIAEVERSLIENVLEHTEGNQLKAARILGINRNTLQAKIKKFGIKPVVYKSYK